MLSSTSAGLVTSLCARSLVAMVTGSLSTQALIFSALDMTISSIASQFFIQKRLDEGQYSLLTPLLTGRVVGFIAAIIITAATTGMVDLPNLMFVSGLSQTAAYFVWSSLPYESMLFIG